MTAVKTGFPPTSITWPYRGLRCRPIEVEHFFKLEVIRWQVTSFQMITGSGLVFLKIHMKYVMFMCRTSKSLISNWPRTWKFSQLLQAGKTVSCLWLFLSHLSHALVTLYFQFLCSDWSKFDRWVHVENLCSILKLFYFESWSWQSFVSTCDVLYCLFYWNYKMKFICYQESLLIMASLFVGFLVGKYVACQSRKSDFGWRRFCFWPSLMRKLSGAASQMVSLSD